MKPTYGRPVHLRVPIHWEETDTAGVVFYGNYFRFFEHAEEEMFRARGRARPDILREHDIWLPRVEAHGRFVRPVRYGDEIDIVVAIGTIGTRSIRFEFEIHRADATSDSLLVEGYTVVVCVSRATFRAVPFPDAVRRLLEGVAAPARKADGDR